MTHKPYSFRPAPVTALARGFTSSADQLDGRVAEFATQAASMTDALDATPESAAGLSPYMELTRRTATTLKGISVALRDHTAGLHDAVASYQVTEDARTQLWGK
ncbi:ESX-1 secretion-associated protein [Streptomyces sp. S186]|uniref:ESX-1 secretion-associated protein n=1 Tax=Streptomyces sp. S186 TaxID=3434395 RepID=UPI003F664C00